MRFIMYFCSVCLVVTAVALPASAGMITGAIPDPGATVFPPIHMLLNNDDQSPDNYLFVSKVFLNTEVVEVGTPIDIEFTVADSGTVAPGVTEYLVQESVDNDTGVDWIQYEVFLGFGTGDDFQQSPAGDGLDGGGLDPVRGVPGLRDRRRFPAIAGGRRPGLRRAQQRRQPRAHLGGVCFDEQDRRRDYLDERAALVGGQELRRRPRTTASASTCRTGSRASRSGRSPPRSPSRRPWCFWGLRWRGWASDCGAAGLLRGLERKRDLVRFAGTARRVLRTKRTRSLFRR